MTERICRAELHIHDHNWTGLLICTRPQGHPHQHTQAHPPCDATTVYWPDVEAIDVQCHLTAGHDGPHEDQDGDWTDD